MTAVWLTATYTTTALLIAVRLGRRLRNQGERMDITYHRLLSERIATAATDREWEHGDDDMAGWHIELLTSDGERGSVYDGLRYAVSWMHMTAMPAPEGESA